MLVVVQQLYNTFSGGRVLEHERSVAQHAPYGQLEQQHELVHDGAPMVHGERLH